VVVTVGVAIGEEHVVQLNPAAGVHTYVIGVAVLVAPAVIETLDPEQIDVS
jgi:hypothetical protein